MAACKCSPCGRSFTGLASFDQHQDVDYSRRPAVQCKDPATLGLVQNEHGRWGAPQTEAGRERLAAMASSRLRGQAESAKHGGPGVNGGSRSPEAARAQDLGRTMGEIAFAPVPRSATSRGTTGAASELRACAYLMDAGWYVYRCESPTAPFDAGTERGGGTDFRSEPSEGFVP